MTRGTVFSTFGTVISGAAPGFFSAIALGTVFFRTAILAPFFSVPIGIRGWALTLNGTVFFRANRD